MRTSSFRGEGVPPQAVSALGRRKLSVTGFVGRRLAVGLMFVLPVACSSAESASSPPGGATAGAAGAAGSATGAGGAGTAGTAAMVAKPILMTDASVHVALFENGSALLRARRVDGCETSPPTDGSNCWQVKCPPTVDTNSGTRILPDSTISADPIGLVLNPGAPGNSLEPGKAPKAGTLLTISAVGPDAFSEQLAVPDAVSGVTTTWNTQGLEVNWVLPPTPGEEIQVVAGIRECRVSGVATQTLIPWPASDGPIGNIAISTFSTASRQDPRVFVRNYNRIAVKERN